MRHAVPGSPAEITVPWLSGVLADAPGCAGLHVTAIAPHVIGEGFGLDGTVVRLGLETSPAPPPFPLVAKLARAKPGGVEIGFYRTAARHMPIRLPRFLAGDVDEAAARAFLLLECIEPAAQGDALVGATAPQAEAVVRQMARFHAAFAGFGPPRDLPAWGTEPGRLEAALRERIPRFLERYGATLPDGGRELVAALPEAAPAAEARLLAARPTLIHGDLHLDNVLFPPQGEPVILDWTHARSGPAAVDLARFLIEGLSNAARPRLQEALLDSYARLVGGDRERIGADVGIAFVRCAAGAVTWAGAEDRALEHPRAERVLASLVKNATAAALDAQGAED
jgi:aminoglycoside phosphotransferase (APT) family kinase protein